MAIPLGPAAPIDTLIARWRGVIVNRRTAGPRAPRADPSWPVGDALRRLVWDRAAAHLHGVPRVFVVPDGALSLLPFAALPTGPQSFLVETGPTIHYLSSERDLIGLPEGPANQGLLAVGGPAFDDPRVFADAARPQPARAPGAASRRGVDDCGTLQSVSFTPLDETSGEVQDLASLWTAGADARMGRAMVLTGHEATEAAVKHEAAHVRVLHLATHGFFMNGTCLTPLPGGTRGVGGLVSDDADITNPLQLSGLAFAGANLRAGADPERDDGVCWRRRWRPSI